MKIHMRYADGRYFPEEYSDGHAKAGVSYVEITEEDWREWRLHEEEAQGWQDFFGILDNNRAEKLFADAEADYAKSVAVNDDGYYT